MIKAKNGAFIGQCKEIDELQMDFRTVCAGCLHVLRQRGLSDDDIEKMLIGEMAAAFNCGVLAEWGHIKKQKE